MPLKAVTSKTERTFCFVLYTIYR